MLDLTTTLGNSSLGASLLNGRRSPSLDDSATVARKRNNRSSVANLEAMRNTQLQALWKNIEGSQKFLPAIPGRHIVQESGYWVELDAATWKPRRPVHIVLLNDHLLIATKKRKRVDPNTTINGNSPQKAPTKLVAEKCWPLQEIDMLDLASGTSIAGPSRDVKEIANAISIRHGREAFTYRSDHKSSSEKLNLLLSFKRTLEELRKAERADVDEGTKAKETINYLAARDPAISSSPNLLRSLSKSNKDRPEHLIDVDGKQRNLRWIEGQIDELDIEIALQNFDEAVQHVEQLRRLAKGLKNNTVVQDLISVKVDERARKLAGTSIPNSFPSSPLLSLYSTQKIHTLQAFLPNIPHHRSHNRPSHRHPFLPHSHPNQHFLPAPPLLHFSRPKHLSLRPEQHHPPACPPMRLRRRPRPLHHPALIYLFHSDEKHRQDLSAMFSTSNDERGGRVGEGTAR